jgi:integrase
MTSDTSPRPISPLRARMIEDVSVRGFKEDTRRDYVRQVRAFAAFIGRSPDTATAEELRLFQLHQTQSGTPPPSINGAVSALRFFFNVTLDRPDLARRLTVVPYPRRIPVVLSVEEVMLLLQAASAPKYKAAFATAYGAGLRVSEVVALKVGDIDSERMLLRVEHGKGGKDRHAMLSPQLLELLRLVARGAAAQPAAAGRLAISRPQPGRAAIGPPALPRCPRSRPGRRDHQARLAAHAAAQLRHPPARTRRRHSRDPDAPRSRDILPANTRSRDGFTIRSTLGVARPCSLSGNTPTAAPSWSSFRSLTGRLPASPRG